MTIDQIFSSSGEYNLNVNGSLEQVDTDTQTAQTEYNTRLSALNTASSEYLTAKAELQSKINELKTLLQNDPNDPNRGALESEVLAAISDLENSQEPYYTALDAFKYASVCLRNVRAARQEFLANASNTAISQAIAELSGHISASDLTAIETADNTRQQAQSNLSSALANFKANELLIVAARRDLIMAQDLLLINEASALAAEGLQPESSPGPKWADYTDQEQVVSQLLSQISGYLSTRVSATATLDNAATAYTNSLQNTTDGVLTLLKAKAQQTNTLVQNYITAITGNTTEINNLLDTTYQQKIEDATLQEEQHFINFTIEDQDIEADTAAVRAYLSNTIATTQLNTATVSGINIALPALINPATTSLPMSDLMRFITQVQLIIQELVKQIQKSDLQINNTRMRIWQLISTLLGQTTNIQLQHISAITQADTAYNAQVQLENQQRYDEIVTAIEIANAAIERIEAVNSENATKNTQNSLIISKYNAASNDAIGAINEANKVKANTINILDLFSSDTDISLPTPQSIPTPLTSTPYPSLQEVATITNPPSYNSNTSPSSTEIDAFNDYIRALNQKIYPLRDVLGSFTTPLLQVPLIPLLAYRQTITVRQVSNFIDVASIAAEMIQGLYETIQSTSRKRETTEEEKELFDKIVPRQLRPKEKLEQPIATLARQVADVGAGAGLAASDILVSPGKIGSVLTQLAETRIFKETLKNLIEKATILAAIQTGIKPPPIFENYSVLGIVENDVTAESTRFPSDVTTTTDEQLLAVARQLLEAGNNTQNIDEQAKIIIASFPQTKNLTDEELKELLAQLAFLLQLFTQIYAALAIASIGTQGNPAAVERNITTIIGTSAISPSNDLVELVGNKNAVLLSALFAPIGANNFLPNGLQELNALLSSFGIPPLPAKITPITSSDPGLFTIRSSYQPLNSPLTQAPSKAISPPANLSLQQPQNTTVPLNSNTQSFAAIASITTDTIEQVVNTIAATLPQKDQQAFATLLGNFLQPLGVPQNIVDEFLKIPGSVSSRPPLGTAIKQAIEQAPGAFINNLGVNVSALPPSIKNKIATAVQENIPQLGNLSLDQKIALVLATSYGIIPTTQATNLITALKESETTGFSLNTIAALRPTNTSDISPEQQTAVIPQEIIIQFKEAIKSTTIKEDDRKFTEKVVESFAKTIAKRTNFYKFSIEFLLDPAKAMLKNFSIFTAEAGKGGSSLPPNILGV